MIVAYLCDYRSIVEALVASQVTKIISYFHTVLPSCGNNLSSVKLKPSHGMVVLDGFINTTSPKVPYLQRINLAAEQEKIITYTNGLVETAACNMNFIKL